MNKGGIIYNLEFHESILGTVEMLSDSLYLDK